MGIWGEMWGCVEVSRNRTRESKTTWRSCNAYVSNFVAVSWRCARWAEGFGDGVSTSSATCCDFNGPVLQKWLAPALYVASDIRGKRTVHLIFEGASTIQRILKTRPLKFPMAQVMSRPSSFKVQLYFHALGFLEECMQTSQVPTVRNCISGMRLVYMVQVVVKDWNARTRAGVLGTILIALQPYNFYEIQAATFEGTGSREELYAPQLDRRCYAGRFWDVLPMRIKMEQWQMKHLAAAMRHTKIWATLHLQRSARSIRWWRIDRCIRWKMRNGMIDQTLQNVSWRQKFFCSCFRKCPQGWWRYWKWHIPKLWLVW